MDFFNQPSPSSERPGERVLTVAQLTRKIRDVLERQFGTVWVKGEISNLRRQSSGHVYFTLKDAEAQLNAVMFRSDAQHVRTELRDGLQILAQGEISVFEQRGQYQIIVRRVQESGAGQLQAKFEALKRKLQAEGLFDASKKRPLPRFPQTVAIVTSPTGAALRDMLNVFERRAPWLHVLVFPVRVQGEGAYLEITRALEFLSQPQEGLPPLDVVVLARGGGSLEDLWNFNEEPVARAMAACPVPVISAVGHEIDFTIADFAADVRAPTPSAAAELVAPDQAELTARLGRWEAALTSRVERFLEQQERVLNLLDSGVLDRAPLRLLEALQQRVDWQKEALDASVAAALANYSARLDQVGLRLESLRPAALVEKRAAEVTRLEEKLHAAAAQRVYFLNHKLDHLAAQLKSVGPQTILARGFSYTTDAATGQPLRSVAQVRAGARIETTLADGAISSVVEATRRRATED